MKTTTTTTIAQVAQVEPVAQVYATKSYNADKDYFNAYANGGVIDYRLCASENLEFGAQGEYAIHRIARCIQYAVIDGLPFESNAKSVQLHLFGTYYDKNVPADMARAGCFQRALKIARDMGWIKKVERAKKEEHEAVKAVKLLNKSAQMLSGKPADTIRTAILLWLQNAPPEFNAGLTSELGRLISDTLNPDKK